MVNFIAKIMPILYFSSFYIFIHVEIAPIMNMDVQEVSPKKPEGINVQ
jgi:hypothetical protein